MDYEKKYKDALERAQKELQTCGSIDCDAAKQIFRFFPELKESEDEKIRKRILLSLEKDLIATKNSGCNTKDLEECIAWLEKQKVTDEEIIFRPVVGTDIRIAAKQALEKIGVGKKVVLAFNGAYIPVNGKTVGEIDSEYDAWLKKQSDTNKTINRNEFAQGVLRGAAINLITWIDYNTAKGNMCLSNMECKVIEDALVNGDWDKIYAYIKRKLEKQGEQNPVDFKAKDWYVSKVDGKIHNMTYNPTDKVEPKFKVGDWVVASYDNVNQVVSVDKDGDGFTLDDGTYFSGSWCDMYHLWTIQDAKDGDVLACENGWTCIFSCLNDNLFNSHCFMDSEGWFCEDGGQAHTLDKRICGEIHPATKKQRELLFKKMNEAGYEWDAEKKELKKIEQIPMMEMITPEESLGIDSDTYNKIVDECIYGEQKLTWSEKDEENLNQLHKLIVEKAYRECEIDDETLYGKWLKLDNWLKSLKERMKGE